MVKSKHIDEKQISDASAPAPEECPQLKSNTEHPSIKSTVVGLEVNSQKESIESTDKTLHRYTMISKLGSGGFAEVWKAYDNTLKREVAVKIPHDKYSNDPEMLKSIQAEAEKLASLNHPGIVSIYDICRQDGKLIIVSELKSGGTLAEVMRSAKTRFSIEVIVDWMASIADSLHVAHRNGLIHRDIKPGNILFDNHEQPCVSDFGLACSEYDQLFESQAIVGTVSYMSPEQALGKNKQLNPQTDIYSLGVILYELLTGRLPFVAAFVLDYQDQVVNRPPRPLRTIEDSIPAQLEQICLKCLEKSPADRYTTAKDLADALRKSLILSETKKSKHVALLAIPAIAILIGFAAMLFIPDAPAEQNTNSASALLSSQEASPSKENQLPTKLNKKIVKLAQLKPVVTLTPLIWPRDSGVSDYSILKDRNGIRFNSDGLGLLAIDSPKKVRSIQVEIDRQFQRIGTGLFFNYRVNLAKREAAFETINIRMYGGSQNRSLHLYREKYTCSYPDATGYLHMTQMQKVNLNMPDRRKNHLQIEIEDGSKLRSVILDNVKYNSLCDTTKGNNKETKGEAIKTQCGFYTSHSTGAFTELKVNGLFVSVSTE